jgi:formyl-CoA transferase
MELVGRLDLRDDPELAGNPGRVKRAAELDQVIGDWAATRTAAEVVDALRAIGVPTGPIQSIADIATDPQFLARDMILTVDSLAGTVLMPGIVPKLSATPGAVRWAGPAVGRDTDEVLGQAGIEPPRA